MNPTISHHLHYYHAGTNHRHPLPGSLQQPPNWSSCFWPCFPVVYYPQSSCRDPGKVRSCHSFPQPPPVSFVWIQRKFQRPYGSSHGPLSLVLPTHVSHLTSHYSPLFILFLPSWPPPSSSNIQQRPLPQGLGIGPPTGHVLSQEIRRAYFLTLFKTLLRCHLPLKKNIYFTEVWLIYNVELVSGVYIYVYNVCKWACGVRDLLETRAGVGLEESEWGKSAKGSGEGMLRAPCRPLKKPVSALKTPGLGWPLRGHQQLAGLTLSPQMWEATCPALSSPLFYTLPAQWRPSTWSEGNRCSKQVLPHPWSLEWAWPDRGGGGHAGSCEVD